MQSAPSLSRTSSAASISSSDDAGGSGVNNPNVSRRTRKRFTNAQLTMLENLFHQNSHPSREERDIVARLGGMETKSVTIWFQNKRQTERKVAAMSGASNVVIGRSHSLPIPSTTRPSSSRPSLDSIAARSELPMPPPRTPTRRRDPTAAIWDNMPSSPIAPPFSPPVYLANGKAKRTLEWACAAARLSDRDRLNKDKDHQGQNSRTRPSSRARRKRDDMKADWTDEDTDEAITPPSTMAGGDVRWTATEPGGSVIITGTGMGMDGYPKGVQDDDMMKAALTLCGLGRR